MNTASTRAPSSSNSATLSYSPGFVPYQPQSHSKPQATDVPLSAPTSHSPGFVPYHPQAQSHSKSATSTGLQSICSRAPSTVTSSYSPGPGLISYRKPHSKPPATDEHVSQTKAPSSSTMSTVMSSSSYARPSQFIPNRPTHPPVARRYSPGFVPYRPQAQSQIQPARARPQAPLRPNHSHTITSTQSQLSMSQGIAGRLFQNCTFSGSVISISTSTTIIINS